MLRPLTRSTMSKLKFKTKRHSARPATSHLRWETARRRAHFERLQHPERVHIAFGVASPRWCHRAVARSAGEEVQLRQDDLPQVLRSFACACGELPQEEVRPHEPAPPEEEAQVRCGRVL